MFFSYKLKKHLSADQNTLRGVSQNHSKQLLLHLTPRKVNIEENIKTKKTIKKGKQHAPAPCDELINMQKLIGEPHAKYSSSRDT